MTETLASRPKCYIENLSVYNCTNYVGLICRKSQISPILGQNIYQTKNSISMNEKEQKIRRNTKNKFSTNQKVIYIYQPFR